MSNWSPDPRDYAASRHPDLPWGYWLRKDSAFKGRVRQRGVKSGMAIGRHFQAALGVICSG